MFLQIEEQCLGFVVVTHRQKVSRSLQGFLPVLFGLIFTDRIQQPLYFFFAGVFLLQLVQYSDAGLIIRAGRSPPRRLHFFKELRPALPFRFFRQDLPLESFAPLFAGSISNTFASKLSASSGFPSARRCPAAWSQSATCCARSISRFTRSCSSCACSKVVSKCSAFSASACAS